jgi:hypothetical protein
MFINIYGFLYVSLRMQNRRKQTNIKGKRKQRKRKKIKRNKRKKIRRKKRKKIWLL